MANDIPDIRDTYRDQAVIALAALGITADRAFSYHPSKLSQQALPIVVADARAATYNQQTYGSESVLIRRQMWLKVYVQKGTIGVDDDMGNAEAQCDGYLDALMRHFAAYTRLPLPNGGVMDVELSGDDGISAMNYGGVWYTGVVLKTVAEFTEYIPHLR